MNHSAENIHHPVQRNQAERNILVTLICFGLTVALTRLFLDLTGYPQIGNSEIHVAHVLWGGLFLFAAVIVLLLWANSWVYSLGAILGGIGVGLFMDEVGKFITQSNNYFTPWAAPIIYAFFLLTVVVYLRVNHQRPRDPRTEMYHALALLTEVLDHDLEPEERAQLLEHLQFTLKNSEGNPDLEQLSSQLLGYCNRSDLHLSPPTPDIWQRLTQILKQFETRWIKRGRARWTLILAIGALAILSLTGLVIVIGVRWYPDPMTDSLARLISSGPISHLRGAQWFTAYTSMNGVVGLLLLTAMIFLLTGKEKSGLNLAYFGLLLDLTITNLLAFYFDQFSAIFMALLQLTALIAMLRYRSRFIRGG